MSRGLGRVERQILDHPVLYIPYRCSKIARLISAPYPSTHRALKRLTELGLMQRTADGHWLNPAAAEEYKRWRASEGTMGRRPRRRRRQPASEPDTTLRLRKLLGMLGSEHDGEGAECGATGRGGAKAPWQELVGAIRERG
jgi:hypothetical protein